MDDSRSLDSRRWHTSHLSDLALLSGHKYFYAGLQEKMAYIKQLVRCGIEPDVATFGLLGEDRTEQCTIGANRNCVLLDAVGECAISVDDDMLCKFALHPQRSSLLRVSGHENPRDIWFFRDRKEIWEQIPWVSGNLVGEHERLLGSSISNLLLNAKNRSECQMEGICEHLSENLLSGSARVVASMLGVVGDSGGHSSSWLLLFSGKTRSNLLESRAAYDIARNSREILGVTSSLTLSHSPLCAAGSIGIDVRNDVPPFFPIARAEDGVFGALLINCFPRCYFGHIPVALFHNSSGNRSYQEFPQFRISDLMLMLIYSFHVRRRPMGSPLRILGRHLEEIARLDGESFWEYIVNVGRAQQGAIISSFQNIIDAYGGEPAHWRQDMENWRSHVVNTLDSSAYFVPIEYRVLYPLDIARKKARDLVKKAGRFFQAWQDMLSAAHHLKIRDIRISSQQQKV